MGNCVALRLRFNKDGFLEIMEKVTRPLGALLPLLHPGDFPQMLLDNQWLLTN